MPLKIKGFLFAIVAAVISNVGIDWIAFGNNLNFVVSLGVGAALGVIVGVACMVFKIKPILVGIVTLAGLLVVIILAVLWFGQNHSPIGFAWVLPLLSVMATGALSGFGYKLGSHS